MKLILKQNYDINFEKQKSLILYLNIINYLFYMVREMRETQKFLKNFLNYVLEIRE